MNKLLKINPPESIAVLAAQEAVRTAQAEAGADVEPEYRFDVPYVLPILRFSCDAIVCGHKTLVNVEAHVLESGVEYGYIFDQKLNISREIEAEWIDELEKDVITLLNVWLSTQELTDNQRIALS